MTADKIASEALELTDGRLRLRPWRGRDAMALFEAARESVDSVGRWLPWCHADYAQEDASTWIVHCQSGWQSGEHFAFPIFDDASGKLFGGVGLNQYGRFNRSANLGYWRNSVSNNWVWSGSRSSCCPTISPAGEPPRRPGRCSRPSPAIVCGCVNRPTMPRYTPWFRKTCADPAARRASAINAYA